jgi:hypothetical protein
MTWGELKDGARVMSVDDDAIVVVDGLPVYTTLCYFVQATPALYLLTDRNTHDATLHRERHGTMSYL